MPGSPASNDTPKPAARVCPHCHGPIEQVGQGRGGRTIERCRTCGREPVELPRDAMAERSAGPRLNMPLTGKPCSVDGCPGTLDGSGRCVCCEKRAAYAEAHVPKRKCKICEGSIESRGGRECCDACKPVMKAAQKAAQKATK